MGSDDKRQKRNTMYQTAVNYYEKSEIRCPECGKLIVKGSFAAGSYLDMRCPNNGCRYHREPLVLFFQDDETTKHNHVQSTQKPTEAREVRNAGNPGRK